MQIDGPAVRIKKRGVEKYGGDYFQDTALGAVMGFNCRQQRDQHAGATAGDFDFLEGLKREFHSIFPLFQMNALRETASCLQKCL